MHFENKLKYRAKTKPFRVCQSFPHFPTVTQEMSLFSQRTATQVGAKRKICIKKFKIIDIFKFPLKNEVCRAFSITYNARMEEAVHKL